MFSPAIVREADFTKVDGRRTLASALCGGGVVWAAVRAIEAVGRYAGAASLALYPPYWSLLSIPLIGGFQYLRALHAAKEANLEEYIHSEVPSAKVNRYIAANPEAVQDLIDRKADLMKMDDKGCSLLYTAASQFGFDAEVFSLLLNAASWPTVEILKCLKYMAGFREDLLAKVIEKKLVLSSDLTPEEQMGLWMSIRSQRGAELLKQMGCGPNVRNEAGWTPLLKTAQGAYLLGTALSQVKRLIAAGANPQASVRVCGIEKGALQLAKEAPFKEPELIAFLERKRP